ncbi:MULTISPECIES: hypothetical protein [Actinomadura]|uniref:DUF8094 domain-containing protein n=1 Tax=Actinomadura yumaensis TaxID=111807 RepID=A0ABW2CTV5_9ACTN|nr:hypothetical protein [Actinomadura sp. J1-007]MWK36202.1 hypothetical protein [Actinomadura sp. J1-007]
MRRFVALCLAGVSVLAGCSDGGADTGTADAADTGDPAVSADESGKVLDAWAERHNEAITSGDERLWRDTVAGALAAPVGARVRTYGKMPGSAKISLHNPVLYVPRQEGYPKWFAAALLERSDGKEQQILAVFVQERAKDDWRAAHWLAFKGRPPELAYDSQGYAIPASGRDLPAAHAAYLTAGDESGLVPDQVSVKARATARGDWRTGPGRVTPGPGVPYALRTKDGGSLVWYGLTQRQELTGGSASRLPGELRDYLAKDGDDPEGTVQAMWQWLAIGYSPAAGKGRVLGESVSLTSALVH